MKAFGASVREAPRVEFRAGQAFFRGEPLHGTPVNAFEGAAACVMTSRPIRALDLHSVALEDLF